MLSKKMQDALNEQINAEIWSAYLYLSMSAYFEDQNLPGFANWMKTQWQEEISHSIKMFDYINERGGRVILKPIAEVKTEWTGAIEVFTETLDHERLVSSLINKLVDIAISESDHATNNMLQWFVAEQVEEEANAESLLQQLIMIDGFGHGMLMLDRELAQRTFVDPTKETE
jgi:ferritin